MFERTLFAGWGDMDFNSHMKNTAYLDKSADVRMMFFAEWGFPTSEFRRLKIGPVIMKDEIEYFREVHLLEEVKVNIAMAGLSEDGSRFSVRNEFFRHDGKPAAKVTSTGGWMDLSVRKLVVAPPALLQVLRTSPKTADFQQLPTSVKR
ncbi:MAG TPA: thioesterase family protein [Terriglobales bacterium]|nr:thioesterase family protein [Terriglobales bacterium]